MRRNRNSRRQHYERNGVRQLIRPHRQRPARKRSQSRPAIAFRQRGVETGLQSEPFNAPEDWHEPEGDERLRFVRQPAGEGYRHAVTVDEVRDRIDELPARFTRELEVVQFSRMTKKRALFPCYGMQWGSTVYLYPIEESLVETYVRPPHPQQLIEAKMYGGKWRQEGTTWYLEWTEKTIRDFYLNNILIHEIGHIYDDRNTSFEARERYANWFAVEYGYRASRGRR